ncbi:sensor histidine kinase [Myceligenerans indicum]|uniref:sensor histidine kinase n=1 Tax=Myceligenerans indicum TaxID=2593663 RepID=UPI00191E72ED|nr:histidine kinase [Myceligenerans indicum]
MHAVAAPLSALVVALLVYSGARAWQVAATALAAVTLHAALEVSRRRPVAGFAVASAAMLGLVLTPTPGWEPGALPSAVCFLVALWRTTAATGFRLRLAALLVSVGGIVLSGLVSWYRVDGAVPAWMPWATGTIGLGVVAAVWAAAIAATGRKARAARAEARRLAAAVSAERAHLRRDLHDVIAHSITVMVARVDAASVTTSDAGTGHELEDVADAGRDALGALRSMLTVLDAERPTPGKRPLTVAALPELVEAAATPLHRVTFTEAGARRPLTIGAELAVVRVVQEGITNALRHVRSPVAVEVRLDWRGPDVVVEVRDDGGDGVLDGGSPGTGLAGVRERVEAAQGSFTVARAAPGDGGWALAARLPAKGAP